MAGVSDGAWVLGFVVSVLNDSLAVHKEGAELLWYPGKRGAKGDGACG